VIPIEDQVVFAVGDATGHSIPAAMIMSTIRGSLRTLLTNGLCDVERPDTILRQINAAYSEYAAIGFYMSMVVGVINTRTRTLRFSNAGHPLPILFRNDECHTHPSHGLLLGIDADAEYGMTAVTMKPNDLLVMYTDGITEAMDADGAMFESAGLIRAVGDAGFSSADATLENIIARFEAHAAGVYQDDHSLFVLRAGVS
jgi:sigma-B regulation protein RsbU (phosphoserine phosphatase)